MRKFFSAYTLKVLHALLLCLAFSDPALTLRPNLIICQSCRIAKGIYRLPSSEQTVVSGTELIPKLGSAIRIAGNNLVVDFTGAQLEGTAPRTPPDQRRGLAIEVFGNNITIKNVKVKGYKVGLIARNCRNLKIVDCDFSYNYKQHLKSNREREDESDWMSYHHNEHDEWLRYGAAMYLSSVQGFLVKRVTVEGGQCGLMLNRCESGQVLANNFSFLSGVGLGLYRTSHVEVRSNNIDWCARGFSEGSYYRGQDSAGILVFEQSNDNLFAHNSVTHGGDGFFLWAGQSTMDTGEGGCNRNRLYGNDFSEAITNGIEATFSTNQFINNKIEDCWHGVWGGYSYGTKIAGNRFRNNQVGIAIEHGQNNEIFGNRFDGDKLAIQLWQNPIQDPSWGYPKHHDTESHGYQIAKNDFENNPTAISLKETRDVATTGNRFRKSKAIFAIYGANRNLKFQNNSSDAASLGTTGVTESKNSWRVSDGVATSINGWHAESPSLNNANWNPFLNPLISLSKHYLLIDEWGPYDFKRPILWQRSVDSTANSLKFDVMGPRGKWSIVKTRGVSKLSNMSGTVPGTLTVPLDHSRPGPTQVQLSYRGQETTDAFGNKTPAGKVVNFGFEKFFLPLRWNVQFFKWRKTADPADVHSVPDPAAFHESLLGKPLRTVQSDDLQFAGYSFLPGLPVDHFATVANAEFDVPIGDYNVDLTTDDGAKVWVDDQLVIANAWHYQGPTSYVAKLHLGGHHKIHVEHFQIDGYATLKLDIKPVASH